MKTRDLIAKLQELDPDGDIEVCVENADLLAITLLPAWYDGRLQVMERPGGGYPKGYKVTSHGDKINIQPWSWRDALYDFPDIPITCDPPAEHEQKRIDQSRVIARARLKQWGAV